MIGAWKQDTRCRFESTAAEFSEKAVEPYDIWNITSGVWAQLIGMKVVRAVARLELKFLEGVVNRAAGNGVVCRVA